MKLMLHIPAKKYPVCYIKGKIHSYVPVQITIANGPNSKNEIFFVHNKT